MDGPVANERFRRATGMLPTILIWMAAIPVLLLIPLILTVVESQLFGTHVIDNGMTAINLDDFYLWIYHMF